MVVDGPNQLWVADLTYVAVTAGFVYVAVILDAWSRRVVGYAVSRSIDARLTVAALRTAIQRRNPPPSCVHHSDRGSQYAAGIYRELLDAHRLVGSMGRRGNPYDNAKAESFMNTLKVEAVYPMAYETFADVATTFPASSTKSTTAAVYTLLWATSARCSSSINTPGSGSKPQLDAVHRKGPTPSGSQSCTPIHNQATCSKRAPGLTALAAVRASRPSLVVRLILPPPAVRGRGNHA
jgi:transposase InsO family protein